MSKVSTTVSLERAFLQFDIQVLHSKDALRRFIATNDKNRQSVLQKTLQVHLDKAKRWIDVIKSSDAPVVKQKFLKLRDYLKVYQTATNEAVMAHRAYGQTVDSFKKKLVVEKKLRHKIKRMIYKDKTPKLGFLAQEVMYKSKEALFQYMDVTHIEQWQNAVQKLHSEIYRQVGLQKRAALLRVITSYSELVQTCAELTILKKQQFAFAAQKMVELNTIIVEIEIVLKQLAGAVRQLVANTMHNTFLMSVTIFGLAFLLAIIWGIFLTNYITGPLKVLTKGSVEIGQGKWDTVLAVKSDDELGELACAFLQMRDNLHQRTAEIIASRNYVENIIRCMMDMLIVLSPEGRIKSINRATLEILKYTEDELIGREFSCISKQATFLGQQEQSFMAKGGQKVPVLFSGAIMQANDEKIEAIVCVVRDISEQKITQQQLHIAKEEADRANNLKSKFLANVSHEIRNPITGIVGMLELLKLEPESLSQEQKSYIETAKSCGTQLVSIVNDIMDLSKIEAGVMTYDQDFFCWKELVADLIKSFKVKLKEKNITVELGDLFACTKEYEHQQGPTCRIVGDKKRCTQVLGNLVINAIKFTQVGGKINIDVNVEACGEMAVSTIKVIDNGCGIAKEDIDNIWGSFVQVDASYSRLSDGVGLGLSISKRIIEGMSGKIWCESQKGKGSTFAFKVALPTISLSTSKEMVAVNKHVRSCKQKAKKILIAEDNHTNQVVLKSMLEHLRYGCEVSENGQLALDKFKSDSFDLVLLDTMMPVMDGVECFYNIRKIDSDIPIIAVTANAMDGDRQKYLDIGFSDYISKPFTMQTLKERLHEAIV